MRMDAPPSGSAVAYAPPPTAASAPSDAEGVGYLKVASALGVGTQALFWVGFAVFYLIVMSLESTVSSFGTAGTSSVIPAWITLNTFYLATGLLVGGLVLGIVSFVYYFLGFRSIKRGAESFRGPTALMIVGLVGFLLTTLGIVVILGSIASAIHAAAAGTVAAGSASLDLNAILGGLGLIGLGAVLALLGVLGLVLGNWRAGTRYASTLAKVGSILSIVPFVSVVGYVLLLVGYTDSGSKLRNGWVPPTDALGSLPPSGYYPPPGGYPQPGSFPPPSPPQ